MIGHEFGYCGIGEGLFWAVVKTVMNYRFHKLNDRPYVTGLKVNL